MSQPNTDSAVQLVVYVLSASNGRRFKLNLECLGRKVKDLKLRILHDRKIPVECQTLFLCKDKSRLELLKDDVELPRVDHSGSASTLHLYVTKSAQHKSIEKTRRSDFDDWLKRFKGLNIAPHYKEEQKVLNVPTTPTMTAVVPAPAVTARPSRPAERSQSNIPNFLETSAGVTSPTTASAVVPAASPVAVGGNVNWVTKDYNSVADNCHLCNRNNIQSAATHYCHSCDEYSCVMCANCARSHPENHDTEPIQREIVSSPGAAVNHDAEYARALHMDLSPQVDPTRWECGACTVINAQTNNFCTTCETRRPGSETPQEEPVQDYKWQCGTCTYLNLPYRPSCEVCSGDRPADYEIPADYVPEEEERKFVDSAIASRIDLDQVLEEEKKQAAKDREKNRQLLVVTDEQNLIANDETFDCPICFTECEAGEGVKLRECLHNFCKDCLKGHIESSENPEVRCPFMDDDYHCNEAMQEREIKEIAPEFYPRLLEKSLQVAESQAADSYHCKTPNCPGWCTYDEDVNFFVCPVCEKRNCLTCQAIHDNQNCKEYQDDLKRKSEIDVEAKKTQEELERLLQAHEAMHCPKCKIIIMKKAGCDWIQCSVCKTEICWVTRQARWGPRGNGDTSGGCRCGVNGPCARNCGNCH